MKTSMSPHKKKQEKSPKKASVKKAARKVASGPKYSGPSTIGFTKSAGGKVLVPEHRSKAIESGVVPASKLRKGISKARDQISGVLQELLEATRDGYEVTEIELSASFSSDGKFLGFGVGGEMSITFKVRPKDEA